MPVFLIAFAVTVADQLTKEFIRSVMMLHESIPVIDGYFHITYILNRGAAFGLLEDQRWFFLVVALALYVVYFFIRHRLPAHWLVTTGTGLLLGGALGNAIDRAFRGAVVDFFDFRIWPVFNVADIAICVGVGFLLWYSWTHVTKG